MEHNTLFLALSSAILTSLAQGLIIYLLVWLLMKIYPAMTANQRYKIFYTALLLIFSGFIFALIRSYISGSEKAGLTFTENIILTDGNPSYTHSDPGLLYASYSQWIALMYFSGLCIQSLMMFFGLYRIQNIRHDYELQSDHIWNVRLDEFRIKMRIKTRVNLFLSEKMLIPFTAGYLKPMILFPVALLNRLTQEQVEAILLHELAHIKRQDYLFNILQRGMESILFFNPMVWLLSKDIRREREFCCDDMVIDHSKNTGVYAHALLQIAEIRLNTHTLSLAVSGDDKYKLLNRIKRLTDMKTLNSNPKYRLFAVLGIAAICLSLAWVVPADESPQLRKNSRSQAIKTPKIPSIPVALSDTLALPGIPEAPPAPLSLLKDPPLPEVPAIPAIPALPDTNELKRKFQSPEWKKQMEELKASAEEMKKHFEGPEWKKQMEEIKAHSEKMKAKFDSPEWQKEMAEIKANSEELKKKFDSPEWKKQMEEIKARSEKMKAKFDSPEWQKEMAEIKANSEALKKKFDSPEWKKQMEDIKLQAENLMENFKSQEWKQKSDKSQKNTEDIIKR